MIGLEWLEEFLSYGIASTFVKNGRPVSMLIVADVETGKTELLKKLSKISSCLYITSFTRYGLLQEYRHEIETKEIRTIIVPDLIQLIDSVNPNLQNNIITFLNAFVEEGIRIISTYNTQIKSKDDLRVNLIAAIPKSVFFDGRRLKKWQSMGFISRMLPVSYSYDQEVTAKIFDYITGRKYMKEESIELKMEEKEIFLKQELAKKILPLTDIIAKRTETYGFRFQRGLQELACARALLKGRTEVLEEDIQRIIELGSWCNLEFKPIGEIK
jgi:hypothetical protein